MDTPYDEPKYKSFSDYQRMIIESRREWEWARKQHIEFEKSVDHFDWLMKQERPHPNVNMCEDGSHI